VSFSTATPVIDSCAANVLSLANNGSMMIQVAANRENQMIHQEVC
jgi:hypothetical protein